MLKPLSLWWLCSAMNGVPFGWAAAILGASGMSEAVEPAKVVLSNSSAVVQRTAGDALSDLGDERAMKTMYKALEARSKLVRWRAARFLNEVGDHTAVAPLHRAAESEEEFDVQMESVLRSLAWLGQSLLSWERSSISIKLLMFLSCLLLAEPLVFCQLERFGENL